jgi:hypothetical protein
MRGLSRGEWHVTHTARENYPIIYTAQSDPWRKAGYSFPHPVIPPPNYTYLAAEVDVVPHLLPDIHPYWITSLGAVSNPIWQANRGNPITCGTTAYNALLYAPPLAGVINPPGTWVPSSNWQWMEATIATPAPLGSVHLVIGWDGVGTVTYFDDWCRWGKGTPPSIAGFHDIWKPTGTTMKRFSTEHQLAPWSGTQWGRNLQSYAVYVKE